VWCRWCLVLGWAIAALSILPIPLFAGNTAHLPQRFFQAKISCELTFESCIFNSKNVEYGNMEMVTIAISATINTRNKTTLAFYLTIVFIWKIIVMKSNSLEYIILVATSTFSLILVTAGKDLIKYMITIF
jgi:hypothetical protein